MSGPGPHPDPPADLHARTPKILEEPHEWIRVYPLGNDPLYFGRTGNNRFDSASSAFGVCYAGIDEFAAFIETFGSSTGTRVVTAAALAERGLARITSTTPFKLVDLASPGSLPRIGADAQLFSGDHAFALIRT